MFGSTFYLVLEAGLKARTLQAWWHILHGWGKWCVLVVAILNF